MSTKAREVPTSMCTWKSGEVPMLVIWKEDIGFNRWYQTANVPGKI